MAPKRKNDDESTARERKKQKMAVARTIAVQESTASPMPENALAGPSRTVAFIDSKCYPPGLLYMSQTTYWSRRYEGTACCNRR